MAGDSESKAELIEIPASEIMEKILKGEPVEYDHVRILGDLNLRKINLPTERIDQYEYEIRSTVECKIISSSITITDSKFDGYVDFANCQFKKRTEFKSTAFCNYSDFTGAIFEYADFRGAKLGYADSKKLECMYNDFNGDTFWLDIVQDAIGYGSHFDGAIFKEDANFIGAKFDGTAFFVKAKFNKHANFTGATFESLVFFQETIFNKNVYFMWAKLKKAGFSRATFRGNADFLDATFGSDAYFNDAKFNKDATFLGTTFGGNVDFLRTTFNGYARFDKFDGDSLTFKDATFISAKDQEKACRKARIVQAKAGNRGEEEYHFYREMEGARKQKGFFFSTPPIYDSPNEPHSLKLENLDIIKRILLYDVLEFIFVQEIFGYGVRPWRLMGWWFVIIMMFACLYYIGSGISGALEWFDYLKVSFATAIAPGYIAVIINPDSGAGYKVTTVYYQAMAIAETIFGTFLWAGFIATFAKRYMR